MIKAVIFDFDGVLIDSFEIGYGVQAKLWKDISREEYRDMFNGNVYEHKEVNDDIAHRYLEFYKDLIKDVKMTLDVKHFLNDVAKEHSLFIITSNASDIISPFFEKSNTLSMFESIMGLETDKSKVKKFNIIFDDYGFSKEECLFVTDTLGDILEANEVGVKTVAVDFGFHGRDRLEKGNPSKIVSSFDELLNEIKNC